MNWGAHEPISRERKDFLIKDTQSSKDSKQKQCYLDSLGFSSSHFHPCFLKPTCIPILGFPETLYSYNSVVSVSPLFWFPTGYVGQRQALVNIKRTDTEFMRQTIIPYKDLTTLKYWAMTIFIGLKWCLEIIISIANCPLTQS